MRPHIMSGGRYPVLRALGIMYLIGAAVAAIAGIVAACWIMLASHQAWGLPAKFSTRCIYSATVFAGSLLIVLSMLAVSEIIKLFIDMADSLRIMRTTSLSIRPATPMSEGVEVVVSENGRRNRISALDDETAEAALVLGH